MIFIIIPDIIILKDGVSGLKIMHILSERLLLVSLDFAETKSLAFH